LQKHACYIHHHSIASPQHVLVQSALRHPFDPREERQVLAGRQGANERVELGAVADQTAHLTSDVAERRGNSQDSTGETHKSPGET
jgi:hypothetical protein